MLNVVVEKLHHPATAVRRTSLKTVQELHVTSNEAVEGILSCLVEGSNDLQNDALKALENLLGKTACFFSSHKVLRQNENLRYIMGKNF